MSISEKTKWETYIVKEAKQALALKAEIEKPIMKLTGWYMSCMD